MKKILFILLFSFMFYVNIFGQNIKPDFKLEYTETYNFITFSGKVSTSPVTMFLNGITNTDGVISGKYYYDKVKKNIVLYGEIKKGVITLKEMVDRKITGFFSGTINKNNVFEGVWRSVDGKKEFNFSLEKSDEKSSEANLKVDFYKSSYEDKYSYFDEQDDLRDSYFSNVYVYILIDNPSKNAAIDKINIDINNIDAKTATVRDIENYASRQLNTSYNEWVDYHEKMYTDYFENTVDVEYFDGKIINFIKSHISYYGGAHERYGLYSEIYSFETGENISFVTNLVKNVNDRNLINLLRKKLTDKESEMTEDDYFNFEEIRLNDNFFITYAGITFFYNQYEIAAYAYGPEEVFFTFEELKQFIKEDGPYSYLFN